MEILTIMRRNYPKTVLKFRVKDLDKNKCSTKFLEHNLPPETIVYVKCDDDGNIDYRGKKQLYRLYNTSKHDLL